MSSTHTRIESHSSNCSDAATTNNHTRAAAPRTRSSSTGAAGSLCSGNISNYSCSLQTPVSSRCKLTVCGFFFYCTWENKCNSNQPSSRTISGSFTAVLFHTRSGRSAEGNVLFWMCFTPRLRPPYIRHEVMYFLFSPLHSTSFVMLAYTARAPDKLQGDVKGSGVIMEPTASRRPQINILLSSFPGFAEDWLSLCPNTPFYRQHQTPKSPGPDLNV